MSLPSSKKKTSSREESSLRMQQTETTATMLAMDHHHSCQDKDDLLLITRGGGGKGQQHPMGVEHSRTTMDEKGKPWWKRGLETIRQVASNDNDSSDPNEAEARMAGSADQGTHYKPLREDNNNSNKTFHPLFSQSGGNNENNNNNKNERTLRSSLLTGGAAAEPLSSRTVIDVLATSGVAAMRGSTTAQEDALQEDCSFFYKAHDEEDVENNTHYSNQRPTRGRFRALRHEEHQHAFSYQDAVDVLTPSFLQAYKSRYEQLNQADPIGSIYLVSPDQHDLVLSEENNDLVQIQRIVKSETTVNSSIFYEHDGRVLMRLPIDAVRLVMDPDLEAGVLSVEQWRHEKEHEEETGLGHLPREQQQQQQQENQPLEERPPLRYVLTVSPELYRKIVSEMSDSLTNPFCGFSKCCSDNEKADIRIAIFILLFVFFVLFINMEALGPHS